MNMKTSPRTKGRRNAPIDSLQNLKVDNVEGIDVDEGMKGAIMSNIAVKAEEYTADTDDEEDGQKTSNVTDRSTAKKERNTAGIRAMMSNVNVAVKTEEHTAETDGVAAVKVETDDEGGGGGDDVFAFKAEKDGKSGDGVRLPTMRVKDKSKLKRKRTAKAKGKPKKLCKKAGEPTKEETEASEKINKLLREANNSLPLDFDLAGKPIDPSQTLEKAKKRLGPVLLLGLLQTNICWLCKKNLGVIFSRERSYSNRINIARCIQCYERSPGVIGDWTPTQAQKAIRVKGLADEIRRVLEPVGSCHTGRFVGGNIYSEYDVSRCAFSLSGSVWDIYHKLALAEKRQRKA